MHMRQFLLSFFLIFTQLAYPADYIYRHLTSDNGLPHHQVQSLIQDKDGNIWIGTRNGLARYDGYDIKCYYHNDKDSTSLNHNFIHNLFLDSKGQIWIVSNGGICRYQPETDNFHRYKHMSITSMAETSKGKLVCGGYNFWAYDEKADTFCLIPSVGKGYIQSISVDRKDNVYLATNSTIVCYDSSLTRITYPYNTLFSEFLTGADGIVPIFFDKNGALWVGRNGKGVMRIDENQNIRIFGESELSNGIVRSITEDLHHNIWLGTERGVTIISPDDSIEQLVSIPGVTNGISDNAIYSICCDRNNNMWLGSYFGGVDILLSNNKFTHYRPGIGENSIHGKVPRKIVETEPGVYWIATEDGGLNIYDSATDKFRVFKDIPQIGTNIHSLYYDRESKTMWIGTFLNGLFRYNMITRSYKQYTISNGHNLNLLFSITKQRNGRLWVASTYGVFYYDESSDQFYGTDNNILCSNFVYYLCTDHEDNLWIGTVNDGLFCLNNKTGKITQWCSDGDNPYICDDYITYIFEDSNHTIWLGTNNNGVQYLDKTRSSVKPLTHSAILQKSCVCAINEDNDGNLWISASTGLFKYSQRDNTMIRFTTADGLFTDQFNFSSTLLDSNGNLLFGTVNGLVRLNPSTIRTSKPLLTVHFKDLTINNQVMYANGEDSPLKQNIDNTDELVLSYYQAKSFRIEYGVIEPGANNAVEYQVMLEGVDREWRDVGKERQFSGFNLAPGTYVLKIRANNSAEEWDNCKVKSIKIIVRPPFYRSIWAYMVYLLLISLGAYYLYRLSERRMQRQQKERLAQMEKEHEKQLNKAKFDFFTAISHELKTPLSLIAAPLKVLTKQDMDTEARKNLDIALKNARKMESLISELVTFNKIETDQFPFYVQKGNPLEFITLNAMSFHELAEEKHLTLTIDCENNGEEVWFSPSYTEKILNNLLSNAIKFTPENGRIGVKASIVNSDKDSYTYLKLSVSDTGIGIVPEEQENIFGIYYQTKRGYNANHSGWGIGLSLVKRLTEVHHGEISLDSKPGVGSVFTVMLNVSDDAFPQSSYISDDKVIVPISEYKFSQSMKGLADDIATNEKVSELTKGKMNLLIVDDNEDLLSFLANYFSHKYNVITAHNGAEALEKARTENIQLIVSDIMMPEMDGIELCKTLKGDMQTSHIPVILLTAKSEPDDVVEGYKSGAEAYVSKPFEPQILELQIKNIIALQQVRQMEIANSQEAENEATTSTLTIIDRKFIKDINDLVEANIGNSDFAIIDITQHLGVSRSLLHAKMRSLMNMSMGDYIRKKRLDYACQLLRETHSVAETAYKSGFADPNYFSKVFKKFMGVSPTEYINQ